jgi:hypothetical protein
MIENKSLAWSLGVASVCAALLAAVLWQDNADQPTVATKPAGKHTGAFQSVAQVAMDGTQSAISTEAKPSLMQQMLTTKNVRAFVEHAKQYPEKGGVYLAETAMMTCKQSRDLTNPTSHQEVVQAQLKVNPDREKNVPAALAAASQLSARCQGFTEAEYAQLDLYSGKLGEGRAPDPLIVATKKALAAGKRKEVQPYEQRLEYVKLLSTVDVLEYMGEVMSLGISENGSYAVFFEGKPWGGASNKSMQAAQKVIVTMVTSANDSSIYWLQNCAYNLQCDTLDTPEKAIDLVLQSSFYSNKKTDKQTLRKEVTELVPRLKQALDSKNFNAFAPPNKPAG